MCVTLWLFDDPTLEETSLSLHLPRQSPSPQHPPLLGAVRRAKAAKLLLDATYPDTQPQDYDQVTWLAGMGSRLAVTPANFSAEIRSLRPLLDAARAQLTSDVSRRTASSAINKARVRNATALMQEIEPVVATGK